MAVTAALLAGLVVGGSATAVATPSAPGTSSAGLLGEATTTNFDLKPFGFTPAQIRSHYGFNAMGNDAGGASIDGRGQIIGIVLWGAEPNLGAEMEGFDKAYGLEEMDGLTKTTACMVSRTIHEVPCF
jgi:hypothetical protein